MSTWEVIWIIVKVVVVLYLLIGIVGMILLKQTPYAENPIWTMILLWPWYLKALMGG